MDISSGTPDTQSEQEILDLMVEDAKSLFSEDLNDNETAAIINFYGPVAERFAELQEHIGLVLTDTQIDNADGESLDLLTALIGVGREPPQHAFGEVTFYRNEPSDLRDYGIPSGTLVQTDGDQSITFETLEYAEIEQGTTEVDVEVRALDPGEEGNVGSNTITVIRDDLSGIDGVYNKERTTEGADRETDEELRERAKEELGNGSRATSQALLSAVKSSDNNIRSVNIFTTSNNETLKQETDDPGFEIVVDGGDNENIAQSIMDTKAAGDNSYAGYNGEAINEPVETRLGNGQRIPIEFSRPIPIDIYISADLETTDEYEGHEAVQESIVNYIGGVDEHESSVNGDLGVQDDVIHGEVEFAIRTVDGVYDVKNLHVDTVTPPENTGNINIGNGEIAYTEQNNEYIELTN